jgi:hypothetical protein
MSTLGHILKGILPSAYPRHRQSRERNCVQTVVAIALGRDVSEVEDRAGTQGDLTVSQTLELLDSYGVSCKPISARLVADFWPSFYARSGGGSLRGLAFRLPAPDEEVGHAYYVHGKRIYDPATGKETSVDPAALRTLDWLAILPGQA